MTYLIIVSAYIAFLKWSDLRTKKRAMQVRF